MWLFKRLPLLLCLSLTACGFRPLYVSSYDLCEVSYPVKIGTIEDRNGQILRNYLVDRLTPKGAPQKALYTLDVTLKENITDIGVRKDETSRRKQMIITAHMKLKNIKLLMR